MTNHLPLDRKDTPTTEGSIGTDDLDKDSPTKSENAIDQIDIARFGNGNDEDLSKEQYELIQQLYDNTSEQRQELLEERPKDKWWACDYDTCRRYLVARQWKLDAAQAQLESSFEWRRTGREGRDLDGFWQSPKALENPFSLSMRPIGWDKEGRPICYTRFSESYDRWDPHPNLIHMTLLMESCCKMIHERRQSGLNRTASSRQWIFVVDFDGFGWRDQNPKSGILTAQALQHYPEMMHLVVLMNAPFLFSSVYSLMKPFLDDRVKSKVMFVKGESHKVMDTFRSRLGDEAVDWILAETNDSLTKRAEADKTGNRKRYWIPPNNPDEHDSRGLKSYVESDFYVKTPGEAYEERQKEM